VSIIRLRLRWGRAAALVLLGACASPSGDTEPVAPEPGYDLVIRNGRVLDGAGNPWVLADVAVRGGTIAEVGVVPGRGRREIDATGRYISPGWIDMMDQSGQVLLENGPRRTSCAWA
jgi:N-acyl-D-amino-acid deacylase